MTDYAARRTMMVDTQIRPSDVTKFPIIDAFLTVPREEFVPDHLREAAYVGEHIELGRGRVVIDPRTLAKMLDAVEFQGSELVLDLGSGLGYSSAVIARMSAAVVSVEEDEALSKEASRLWSENGSDNVIAHCGPLAAGAAEHGPYDVIVVQGGVETLPEALLSQLKEDGQIVCLFMDGELGVVRVGRMIDGRVNWRFAFNASAPVLPGFERKAEFVL